MRVLIDTCVIIDALQNREPFSIDSEKIFVYAANKVFNGYISAKSLTDIYYLVHKLTHSKEQTKEIINSLLMLFNILDTKAIDCKKALLSTVSDYEDAVMIESAKSNEIECIVTRNENDYVNSSVKIYSPKQFIDFFNVVN